MGWKKAHTVKGISFDYWHVGTITMNNTIAQFLSFDLILYKDKATYDADFEDYWQENKYSINNMTGTDYPLDMVDIKVLDKDNETLIYDKIKSMGTEIITGVDFSDATLE